MKSISPSPHIPEENPVNKVMQWFTEKFAPTLTKVTDHPLIAAISRGSCWPSRVSWSAPSP